MRNMSSVHGADNSMSSPIGRAVAGYRHLTRRRAWLVGGLAVLAILAFLLDLNTGTSGLGLQRIIGSLFGRGELSTAEQAILWQVRLPQSTLAVLVGAALAVAGAEMQTILNNSLASPFTLGVSSAASCGAALAIVLGIGLPGVSQNWIISANAFVFAFGSVLLLQGIARMRGSGIETLILCGIALFFTFNALVALTQFLASQQALQQLVFWIMGSLARADWSKVGLLTLIVVTVMPFSFAASWPMMVLRLGEERARTVGVNVLRLRFGSLLRISALTATSMAFVGTVGFVGLAAPHIARLAVGEDHRFFLPASALLGAAIMSLASVASKAILPGVLIPIGIVTALVGLPVFFSLILMRRYPQ